MLTRCRPPNEPGAEKQPRGSRAPRGPRLGPAASLRPGSLNKISMIDPRRREAERRGSRPRVRRGFTTDPCRDQALSRVGRWAPRMGGQFGWRGALMRKWCTILTARCKNRTRKRQGFFLSRANSSQSIGGSSRLRRGRRCARGGPRDKVPPLSRCQAQGLRGVQAALPDLGDAPAGDPFLRSLRRFLRAR